MNDNHTTAEQNSQLPATVRHDANADAAEQIEKVNVSLEVVWHGTAGKYDARMSEISLESCFIDSMGQEILGEAINFKARLPAGHWINLQGEVVYREYPIGFEARFVNLTEESKRLLVELIAAHGGKQAREMMKAQAAKISAQVAKPKKRRLLVAEDDVVTLRVVTVIAETEGFEVVTATDGREAFRILQRDADFSAAIFDMTMPHLHGMDLIHYMKTDARLSPISIGMITAEQDPKIWNESVTAGASVFLPKPFTPPQIQMMLRMLVAAEGDSNKQL